MFIPIFQFDNEFYKYTHTFKVQISFESLSNELPNLPIYVSKFCM